MSPQGLCTARNTQGHTARRVTGTPQPDGARPLSGHGDRGSTGSQLWVPPSCKASYLLVPRRDRSCPSFLHVTRGVGHPSAWHSSVADPLVGTFTSSGPGWMCGATAAAPMGKGENERQSSEKEKSNPTRAFFPIAPSIGDPKILGISVPDERDAQGTCSPPAKPRGRAMLTVNFHLEALPAVPRCGASPADVLPPVCCPHVPDPQEPALGQDLPVGIPLTPPRAAPVSGCAHREHNGAERGGTRPRSPPSTPTRSGEPSRCHSM